MPAAPTPAQSDTSRANGSLSSGPATPEGRARSSRNATAHGLTSPTFALLPGEDPAEFAALLRGYLARHDPADEAERLWVERMAAAAWRLRRLEALETKAFAAQLADDPAPAAAARAEGPAPRPPLPSLATLARYRARIERDHRHALAETDRLRALRPAAPAGVLNPARLRWLADRIERDAATAAAGQGREGAPSSPSGSGTSEPDDTGPAPAAARPPNRAERRRLAALGRGRPRGA